MEEETDLQALKEMIVNLYETRDYMTIAQFLFVRDVEYTYLGAVNLQNRALSVSKTYNYGFHYYRAVSGREELLFHPNVLQEAFLIETSLSEEPSDFVGVTYPKDAPNYFTYSAN